MFLSLICTIIFGTIILKNENFKVKNAPGLVKLLSLADFGGMVDALSGDGLSFEKLDIFGVTPLFALLLVGLVLPDENW